MDADFTHTSTPRMVLFHCSPMNTGFSLMMAFRHRVCYRNAFGVYENTTTLTLTLQGDTQPDGYAEEG